MPVSVHYLVAVEKDVLDSLCNSPRSEISLIRMPEPIWALRDRYTRERINDESKKNTGEQKKPLSRVIENFQLVVSSTFHKQ